MARTGVARLGSARPGKAMQGFRNTRAMKMPAKVCTCGAKMRWEKTVRGKAIPLDPDPVPGAHLFIREDGLVADDRAHPAPDDAPRYETHFATCPDSATHRRKR
jgi:hypothetical protein